MTINIADFGRNNLMDVPGSLRRLADQMERNEEPMAEHVIVVCETQDGELKCYGYGKVGDRVAIADANDFPLDDLRLNGQR